MLLTINEIEVKLHEKFSPFNGEMDDFILKNRSKVIYNYRLPNIQPVEFIEKELTIHPYVMGILLGDGCLSKNNQPHIVTTDKFVVDKIIEIITNPLKE